MITTTYDPEQWQLVPVKLSLEMAEACMAAMDRGYSFEYISNGYKAALAAAPQHESQWQDISTLSKGEMFIWAVPKGKGKWSLGLGYWNVSGGWSDAYASQSPPRDATHWMPLPQHPDTGETTSSESNSPT